MKELTICLILWKSTVGWYCLCFFILATDEINLAWKSTFSPSLRAWILFPPLPNLLTIYWPHRKEKSVAGDLFENLGSRSVGALSGQVIPLWQEPHAYLSIQVGSGPETAEISIPSIEFHSFLGSSIKKNPFNTERRWRKQYLCERAFGWGQNWIVQMKEVNCVAPPWGTASLRSPCLGKSTGKY